ncbi:MAG: hypothetical protein RLZZ303_1078 [Candidatus Hydrogenedentota bacterium]
MKAIRDFLLAVIAVLMLMTLPPARAQESPVDAPAVRAALDAALKGMAALQRNGGWTTSTTQGRELRWGQDKPVGEAWITLQPPATPSVAEVYLRAAKVLGNDAWHSVAARARDAIVAMQNEHGGFPHEGKPERPPRGAGTFDDGVTTGCAMFLLHWWQDSQNPIDRAVVDRVGGFILNAQYADSGGWPQAYPPNPSGYQKDITLNDGVMRNVLFTLLAFHTATGDVRYLDAAKRGGECLIRLQGPDEEAIWAQQYKHDTLEPSWARNFEPPGYTPNESIGVCDALIRLYFETREERYLKPLPRAFRWYDTHRLENGLYARLYEPGTQRPVYGRRDKAEKVYELEHATGGYGWQGDWYPRRARDLYECIQQEGAEPCATAYSEQQRRVAPPSNEEVSRLIRQLKAEGLWTSPPTAGELEEYARHGIDADIPLVRSGEFVAHAGKLLDWLESSEVN